MKIFNITEEYTFRVTWKIKASNRANAEKMVKGGCGCISPQYQTVLKNDIVMDWKGDVHPHKNKIINNKKI